MEERDEIINDKTRQIIWKTRTVGLMKMEYGSYEKRKIITIWSQPGVRPEQISRALNDASKPGGTYHLYVGNGVIWEKVKALWRSEQIGVDRTFIRCKVMVETIREEAQQKEVTLA